MKKVVANPAYNCDKISIQNFYIHAVMYGLYPLTCGNMA